MLENILKTLNDDCTTLHKNVCLAYWDSSISGKKEDYEKVEKFSTEYNNYFCDKERFELLKNALDEVKNSDYQIQRQYHLFYQAFVGNQVNPSKLEAIVKLETKIEEMFSTFRADVNGEKLTDNQINDVLKTSKDEKVLKSAWTAHKYVGEVVEKDLIDLVKKRNEVAQELWFDNYHTMSLTLSEQNPEDILKIFDELDILTRDTFLDLKKDVDQYFSRYHGLEIDNLQPWHYQDKFFQEAPSIVETDFDKYYKGKDLIDITTKYFDSLWMDIRDMVAKSDLFEKEGKNQHAYCIDVDNSGDVRVLCNIKDNEKWMWTMLHEYGHAVYDKYLDYDMPFVLKWAAHTFTTEAIAMFFGRFSTQSKWMKDMLDVDLDENQKNDSEYMLKLNQLVFSRWAQVMFRFEKELYADPDQDLNSLRWSLVEKYQGITYIDRTTKADWASKLHVATAPCYYHNYLLGEILASQIYAYITKNILKIEQWSEASFYGNKEVGAFLKEKIFVVGKLYRWDEMIKRALGENLTAKYYAKQFVE